MFRFCVRNYGYYLKIDALPVMLSLITQQPASTHKKVILSAFIILMLIHIIFTFSGFYGNDDINYARYAAGIANNGISFTPAQDHYQLRWAAIYATSFFYIIFGIKALTSALCSFVSFALCGVILFKLLRSSSIAEYVLAMTLFFFGHSIIFYSHRLLPDPLICLAVLWMYYTYRSFLLQPQKPLLKGLQFSAALFLAIISKETILIALPLFTFFFLKDILKKQYLAFWKYATIFSLLFLSLYLFYFKITTGDFLYRYHMLFLKSYFNECSFDQLPFINTVKRIGYYLWRAMLLNGDMLVVLPALAAVIYYKKIFIQTIQKTDAFSFLMLLGCANFMSISFTAYVPLCHDPRHFLFLMPFAAVTGGPMLYAYFKNPLKFIVLPLLFIVATSAIFIMQGGTTKYLYLLFTLLLTGYYILFLKTKSRLWYTFSIVATITLFSLNYFIDFIKPMYPYYWDHKKLIEEKFGGKKDIATVVSADLLTAELSEFFLEFNTGNIHFITIDSVKSTSPEKLYFLLNSSLNSAAKNKLDSISIQDTSAFIIIDKQEKNMYLYRLTKATLQKMREQHL